MQIYGYGLLSQRLCRKLECLQLESISLDVVNIYFHMQRLVLCLDPVIMPDVVHILTSASGGMNLFSSSISLVKTEPRLESLAKMGGIDAGGRVTHTGPDPVA